MAILSTVAITVLVFSAAPVAAEHSATQGRTLYVTLSMGIHGSRSGLYVTDRTNLPDRTFLMLDFASKKEVDLPPNACICGAYLRQAKLHVHRGHFRSPRFTFHGGPFPRGGHFRASVITPFTGLQPASVQIVFGLHGKNLRGPLIKRDLGDRLVKPPPVWITVR
jgi:hypothetical protein